MQANEESLILLMGPPNVGKSVIFNYLTGMNVCCANYPGTTIEYTAAKVKLDNHDATLIDVPGTYTIDAENDAERIAVAMLSGRTGVIDQSKCEECRFECDRADIKANKPDLIIFVLDAINPESSLYLLLNILEFNIPVMAILNRCDLAVERGKSIDEAKLSRDLGIPVIPAIAIRKSGFEEITATASRYLNSPDSALPQRTFSGDYWKIAEELSLEATCGNTVLPEEHKRYLRRQKWGLLLVRPWPGLPLAFVIVICLFAVVIGVGMVLRKYILVPLFVETVTPLISSIVERIVPEGVIRNILIGEYGFLTKGIEWPFSLVLPYVLSFYTALAIVENSGYMSRLGALLDGLLHRIGLHGSSVIPLVLGYGCAVPAILSTRALASEKERLIASTLVCISIPCIAQTGAFISLLSAASVFLVPLLFMFSWLIAFFSGIILKKFIKGAPTRTVMEIPELLMPRFDVIAKKVWYRLKNFVAEGALPMIAAVAIASFLYETRIMEAIGRLMSPLVSGWLGLPQDAAVPLVLGIMRRELAVLPLMEMELTTLQLFTGAIVGLLYVPCIAVIGTMAREYGLLHALFMLLLTVATAFFAGGLVSQIGSLF